MVRSHSVETMRTFFRFIELSMRFTPLFIASPLLLTPLADYWYKILLHTLRTSGACFIKVRIALRYKVLRVLC